MLNIKKKKLVFFSSVAVVLFCKIKAKSESKSLSLSQNSLRQQQQH